MTISGRFYQVFFSFLCESMVCWAEVTGPCFKEKEMENTLNPSQLLDTPVAPALPVADLYSTDTTRPFLVRAAKAPVIDVPGERATLMMPSAKTAGRVTAARTEVGVNAGPPPHLHIDAEEIFLIQSGAIEFFVNGEILQAHAGDVVFGMRGESHRFRGLDSGEPNVFNILIAPGGFEHFFTKWADLLQKGAPDPLEAMQLCAEHDITVFLSDTEAPIVENPRSKIVRNGQSALDVLGDAVTVLLDAEDTDGRYSLVRVSGPRDSGPPVHIHTNEDELFLIEAGSFEFTLGEEKVIANAGDVVWGPRGWAHTFRIASEFGQMAVLMNPGGFEGFFRECDQTARDGKMSPPVAVEIGERFGLTFMPPAAQ